MSKKMFHAEKGVFNFDHDVDFTEAKASMIEDGWKLTEEEAKAEAEAKAKAEAEAKAKAEAEAKAKVNSGK